MLGAKFKRRALHEGLRYGEDRMVFLRELAQNARDAGARRIGVTTRFKGNELALTFGDDGTGMSYEHARKYLFTLYASSKEKEEKSAGRFGVGFWSVLLFEASQMEIQSRIKGGAAWAIVLDDDLAQPRRSECVLKAPGTRITIRRTVKNADEATQLDLEIREALIRYCRYLRQNNRSALPLVISMNGKKINEAFVLDGPCWMTFRDGPVEGAVGLGKRPRVDLYARGLLVWRGTLLDELRYGASPVKPMRHPEGLAPVFLLNGNDLNVTLNRRSVIDDHALARVRRVARHRMTELLRRYLDEVSPRPFKERVKDLLMGLAEDIRLGEKRPTFVAITVAVIALIAGALLATRQPDIPPSDTEISPIAEGLPLPNEAADVLKKPLTTLKPFNGPAIDPLGLTDQILLRYSPPISVSFRTTAHENLHAGLGIVGKPPRAAIRAPDEYCTAGCLDVEVEIAADPGVIAVPVPTGHNVEPKSITLDGQPFDRLVLSEAGEPLLVFKQATHGTLKYRTGSSSIPLDPRHRERLIERPGLMRLPRELKAMARVAAKEKTVAAKVEKVRGFVEKRLSYDRSRSASAAYAKFMSLSPKAGWLDFVLTYGRGDCDVKNTTMVVILRRLGVPTRLAVGLVGVEGRVVPGRHAWVEYYDRAWQMADATGNSDATASNFQATPNRLQNAEAEKPPSKSPLATAIISTDFVPRKFYLRIIALAAALVALLSLLVGLILVFLGRARRRMFASGGQQARLRIAAEMVTNALTHPEAWRLSSGVTQRKLFPLLGKKRKMSLAEALDRGRKGKLWLSDGKPDLVTSAVQGGTTILDASDPVFGPLVPRLPRIVDLNEIAHLEPVQPANLPDDLTHIGEHVDHMNRLLEQSGFGVDLIMPSLWLDDAMSRDVDLSKLSLSKRSGWPIRFIALKARSQELDDRATLGRSAPELAAFLTLDMLLANSDLFRLHQQEIRRAAAQAAFEVAR